MKRPDYSENKVHGLPRKIPKHHYRSQECEKNSHVPCDVLHLNIGGNLTAVLRRTLTSVEGSMLASRFSGRWDESLEKDRNGNFFIDQPETSSEERVGGKTFLDGATGWRTDEKISFLPHTHTQHTAHSSLKHLSLRTSQYSPTASFDDRVPHHLP